MSSAKITLIGCENYFQNINQSLFDNLRIPETLDKETLTDNILLRGGEFEIQYGDPDFLRFAIGSWSNKWMPTMERWTRVLAIEYNPLENYDRIEDWTDNTKRSDATSANSTSDRTHGRSEDVSHADSETFGEHRTENGNESHSDAGNESRSESVNESRSDAGNESRTDHNSESGTYSQSDAKTSSDDNEKITDRDAFQNHTLTHTVTRSAYDSNTYEPLTQETDTGKLKETSDNQHSESSASSSDSSSDSDLTSDVSRSSAGSTDQSTEGSSEHSNAGSSERTSSGSTDSSRESSFAESKNENEDENITSSSDSSSAMNNDLVHAGRIHGNIGTLTSQEMVRSELELGYWNVYEKITELFLQEFTIPVYL